MYKLSFVVFIIVTLAALPACTRRMAPFAPHRTNTDFHRTAQANQTCLGCHEIKNDWQDSPDIGQLSEVSPYFTRRMK